jgi:hypothetical protein
MSPYKPFRTRRGIHHFFLVRMFLFLWNFFTRSSWGLKIVSAGVICIFLGLFLPWVEIGDTGTMGAFSLLCGGAGWWISLMMVMVIVMLFSYDYTEKIKKIGGMNLDPKFFYARIGVVIILMNVIISTTLMGAARSINPDINIQLTTQMSGMVFTYV